MEPRPPLEHGLPARDACCVQARVRVERGHGAMREARRVPPRPVVVARAERVDDGGDAEPLADSNRHRRPVLPPHEDVDLRTGLGREHGLGQEPRQRRVLPHTAPLRGALERDRLAEQLAHRIDVALERRDSKRQHLERAALRRAAREVLRSEDVEGVREHAPEADQVLEHVDLPRRCRRQGDRRRHGGRGRGKPIREHAIRGVDAVDDELFRAAHRCRERRGGRGGVAQLVS